MFKKILLATSVLALTTGVVLANPAPYVGASLGITDNTSSNSVGYRGAPVSLFAGYGGQLNQSLYLAGELTGTVGTMQISNSGLKSTYGYGASILPGIMLSQNTVAFGRVGIVRTQFSNISSGGSNVTGGQFGLGLQTSLTQNIDLRGEYDYTAYNSVGATSPRSDTATLGLVYKFN